MADVTVSIDSQNVVIDGQNVVINGQNLVINGQNLVIDGQNVVINGQNVVIKNVVINNTRYILSQVFKTGPNPQQGIIFDEHFWRKVFCGDANKDGCSMDILKKFVTAWGDEDKISAADVKKISSDMTNSLIDNNLIFKAEILRLKKYKTEFPEELKTQFDSAFQENQKVYVNKDCGLNPAIFMVAGKCNKTCNVASDVIDPHSAKTDDCNTLFPSRGHILTLDPSVFEYLQYPRPCRLSARTQGSGSYNLDFRITGIKYPETQITVDYFAGNATKKTSLKKGTIPSDIENNAKLCIAKYSGDTLQSFIQRIFQLHQNEPLNEFVVSTCDSIVALRSFALNSSYIEITDDETKEKVTQVFIWRPNLADPVALDRIFTEEKRKIVKEYDDFKNLVDEIIVQQSNPDHNFNNIYVSGSSTTYKFKNEFYDLISKDIERIKDAIDGARFNAEDREGGLSIRTLRTFKINDFIKINGPRGKYYCITMASKYTKGALNLIWLNQVEPLIKINKRASQSFFEAGTQMFKAVGGKLRNKKNKRDYVGGFGERPPNPMDLINMLNYYYDFDFYKSNPIIKTMFNDGDKDDDDDKARINKNVDLHEQFIRDFKIQFDKHIDIYIRNYNLLFFDCLSDALNSFGVLDIKYPRSRYYSEESIHKLIEIYFSEPSEIIQQFLSNHAQYNTNRLSKKVLKSSISKSAVRSNLDKNSIQRLKGLIEDSQINRKRERNYTMNARRGLVKEKEEKNYTMNARRGLVKGGSKTRKNRK